MSDKYEPDKKPPLNLDDLEKRNIFQVPENYFSELPTTIQSRVHDIKSRNRRWKLSISLKYAIPAVCIIFIGIYLGLFNQSTTTNPGYEEILAEISTEDLMTYLESTDISTEELIASIDDGDIDLDFSDDAVNPMLDIEMNDEDIFQEFIDDINIDSIN